MGRRHKSRYLDKNIDQRSADETMNRMKERYQPLHQISLSDSEKEAMLEDLKARMAEASASSSTSGSSSTSASNSTAEAILSSNQHSSTLSLTPKSHHHRTSSPFSKLMPFVAAVAMIAVVAGGFYYFNSTHPAGPTGQGTSLASSNDTNSIANKARRVNSIDVANATEVGNTTNAANEVNPYAPSKLYPNPFSSAPPVPLNQLRDKSFIGDFGSLDWAMGYDASHKGKFTLLFSPSGGDIWYAVPSFPKTPPSYVLGMGQPYAPPAGAFMDAQTGLIAWIENGSMIVERTTDGAQTMQTTVTSVPPAAAAVQALVFADSSHVFALVAGAAGMGGEQKYLYESTDGGQTWKEVSSVKPGQLPHGGTYVNFTMNADGTGWLTTNDPNQHMPTIYHTKNNGRTWDPVQLPVASGSQAPEQIGAVSLPVFSGSNGVIAVTFTSNNGTNYHVELYKTTDGGTHSGTSWAPASLTTPAPGSTPASGSTTAPFQIAAGFNYQPAIDFMTPEHWFAISGSTVYETKDGGAHWSKYPAGGLANIASHYAGPMWAVHFFDDYRGYVILFGNDGESELTMTMDGGKAWTAEK